MAKKPPVTTVAEDAPQVESEKAVAILPADHIPPVITAADLMASFKNQSEITRQRRLAKLANKHPEIAAMLRSKVKTPTAEAPRIES